MRLFGAVAGAILLVLGLGIVMYLPEGRDTQNRSIAIGITLLLTGATAIGAAEFVGRTQSTAPQEKSPTAIDSLNTSKYLLYAAIPAVICTGLRALLQAEVIGNDTVKQTAYFLFGPPLFLAGWVPAIGGPIVGTGIVSLLYFWLFFIPLGKLAGVLRRKASRTSLAAAQSALGAIHLVWGVAFVLIMRA